MKTFTFAICATSILATNAFAALLTTPADQILGVQLVTGDTINIAAVGTADGVNNHPAGEPPSATIDLSNGTKYLNFGKTNTGIIVDAFDDAFVLTGLELISANDAEERDPTTFSIYGTNVTQSTTFLDYTPIALNQAIALPTGNGSRGVSSGLVTFTNAANTPFDSYLVIFPTIRNEGGANSMQVAEIRLDGTAPIPEPSTFGLIALSTLGMMALRRRRS